MLCNKLFSPEIITSVAPLSWCQEYQSMIALNGTGVNVIIKWPTKVKEINPWNGSFCLADITWFMAKCFLSPCHSVGLLSFRLASRGFLDSLTSSHIESLLYAVFQTQFPSIGQWKSILKDFPLIMEFGGFKISISNTIAILIAQREWGSWYFICHCNMFLVI